MYGDTTAAVVGGTVLWIRRAAGVPGLPAEEVGYRDLVSGPRGVAT